MASVLALVADEMLHGRADAAALDAFDVGDSDLAGETRIGIAFEFRPFSVSGAC